MINHTLTKRGKLADLQIAICRNSKTDFIVNLEYLYKPELVEIRSALMDLVTEIDEFITFNQA